MGGAETVHVEVAHASADEQLVLAVELPAGTTVEQAIRYSGILHRFPEVDLTRNKVGIYGKVCRLDRELADGERVEIYRALIADPKAARRRPRDEDG